MDKHPGSVTKFCARLLTIAMILSGFVLSPSVSTAQTQRPIVITADQPNIWTLEQAHYLLAQMHRRNLDLKAASLEALDANEINAISVDALKTLLSVSAEFDQAIGVNNKLVKDEKVFTATRKRELLNRRARLQDESLSLTQKIGELKIKQARAKTDEEKKEFQPEIDELTIVRETVKEQTTQTNEELKTLPGAGDFTSVEVDAPSTTPANTYAGLFQTTAQKIVNDFNNSPKLNASLRLDNYLQMQYEILSKQLTLLRDEVGPGERLIFMEMPQSINAPHNKADDKWAQSWWKIAGYSECVIFAGDEARLCSKVLPLLARSDVQTRVSSSQISEKIRYFDPNVELTKFKESVELKPLDIKDQHLGNLEGTFSHPSSEIVRSLRTHLSPASLRQLETYRTNPPGDANAAADFRSDLLNVLNKFIRGGIPINLDSSRVPNRQNSVTKLQNVLPANSPIFRRLLLEEEFNWINRLETFGQKVVDFSKQSGGTLWGNSENTSVRVVDMFPRQSSLNVNDLKLRSTALSFKFVFQLLSGIGGGANYQREREQYSQFIQQELYSSAFGKGSREFGWTFNPMPGTSRLMSGVRTTYAIVVVPEDTTSLIVQSKGCYFPRSSSQPSAFDDPDWNYGSTTSRSGCMNDKTFIIPIPDGGNTRNNFAVTSVMYRPEIKKGERTVVTIEGRNFSSQIGVLVDGVPLTQSLGLGQPFIRDDSATGRETKTEIATAKVKGTFERIGSNQIVAAFEMHPDFEGVPTITLVAPGQALDLRSVDGIQVNGDHIYRWSPYSKEWPYLFGKKIGTRETEVIVDKANAFQVNQQLNIVITGKNLNRVARIFVNGESYGNPNGYEPNLPPVPTPSPGPFPSASPSPSTDDYYNKRYAISLTDLAPIPTAKTIQLTLLTVDGAVSPSPIDNPTFKKETPPAESVNYSFDETKFSITTDPTLARCVEIDNRMDRVFFVLTGRGFSDNTKAFVIVDKQEVEQEFIFENSTKGTLKITNPSYEIKVVLKDPDSRLKTQKVITWKKPSTGC